MSLTTLELSVETHSAVDSNGLFQSVFSEMLKHNAHGRASFGVSIVPASRESHRSNVARTSLGERK